MISWLLAGGLEGELVWSAPAALRWGGLALCLGAAAVAGVTAPKAPRRAVEVGLWFAAMLILGLALGGPQLVEAEGRSEPGRLVVLVDGSASMAVLEGGEARSSAVGPLLRELAEQAGDGGLEIYTFDEELRPGVPASYDGRGSDLGVGLSALADRYLGQEVRGVVVLTDGVDRGSLRRDLAEAEAGQQLSGELVPRLPGPVTFYQVGGGEQLQDAAVEDLVTGGFAFLRTPFSLRVPLRAAPGQTLKVVLRRDGDEVARREVVLNGEGKGEARFEVMPTRVGRFVYEASIPVEPQDAVPGNNLAQAVVRVVRDRTRILQVSGSPSHDTKFMRLFLKEDPSVDLVSFFILRTNEDMGAGWGTDELSLIEFPYERLFSDDLSTFDLVIFQNFDYASYFRHQGDELLGNVAEYVRQGGGFVMTGGDRSFDLGRYGESPLAAILPLKLGLTGVRADEGRFLPRLTPAGLAHPMTRLANSPEEIAEVWSRLPQMDGLNRVVGAHEDAAVLLEHPSLRGSDGQAAPVLAVREVGEGRSMALTVDASWRWSFSEAAQGRGNQAYLRFWKNALRWLVADPEDRRVVVSPSRENVLLGDEVRLVVKVRDAGYGPVAGAKITGTVRGPSGEATTFDLVSDAMGEAVTAYRPQSRGAHRVQVSTGAGRAQEAESAFGVSSRDPELEQIHPDARYLATLAGLYGPRGAFRPAGDRSAPLLDESALRLVPDRRLTDLSTAPIVPLLIGLLASLAWWLRRQASGR